ncbi:MAG: TauD/TfdA family dioxygenase, partial [Polyangiales bacterium]
MPHENAPNSLQIRPLTPVIGAEINGLSLHEPLSTGQAAQVEQALHRWRVVFFRDQGALTDEQRLAFGRAFGPLTPAHPPPMRARSTMRTATCRAWCAASPSQVSCRKVPTVFERGHWKGICSACSAGRDLCDPCHSGE